MLGNSWKRLPNLAIPTRPTPGLRRGRFCRPRLEGLEDRLAPAMLDVTSGALAYTAGSGVNNNLSVSLATGTYTFNDTGETITLSANALAAGFAGSGTNTVTGPSSAVSASLSLALGDGTDTLALGPFDATLPALTVTDGGQAGDTATVATGGQGLVTSGAVSLTGFAAISVNNTIDTSSATNGTITLAATVAGGAGLSLSGFGSVSAGSNNVNLSGDPIALGVTVQTSGTVTVTDTGASGVTEPGGSFGGGARLVLADNGASGPFQLTSQNLVSSLTANVHNDILLNQGPSLTLEGIDTNGHNVAVFSHGSVTLGDGSATTENITAANAGVFLAADNLVENSNTIITAYGLSLSGVGTFTLDQSNQVFDLAANITGVPGNGGQGSLDYHSGQAMLTGAVAGLDGITINGGGLTLTSSGLLALGDGSSTPEVVTAVGGPVTLNAAGVFENANATISIGKVFPQVPVSLQLLGSVGDVLDQANVVTTVAANVQGPVTITNSENVIGGQVFGLTVGSVGGTNGISVVGSLTLNVSGPLTLGDDTSTPENIDAASVFLTALSISQASNSIIGNTALSLQGGNTTGIFPDNFALSGANQVHTLAASVQGATINFTNATGLIVGSVGSLNGINTNNNALTLTVSNGLLALGDGTATPQDVNTGTATPQLVANGGLFENSNGAILAPTLVVGGAVGWVADGPNVVGTLTGTLAASLLFADTQLLTVGVLSCPDVTLVADAMDLAAPLRTNQVALEPLTPSLGITLGGTASGTLSLTDADLAALATTNFRITFGRPDGTGPITVAHPVALQTSVVLATTGTITGMANITVPFWATVTTQP